MQFISPEAEKQFEDTIRDAVRRVLSGNPQDEDFARTRHLYGLSEEDINGFLYAEDVSNEDVEDPIPTVRKIRE